MLKSRLISPTVYIGLLVGWVLLLLPAISSPADFDYLDISRVDHQYGVTRFGVFGYTGGVSSYGYASGGYWSKLGYEATLSFSVRYPFDDSGNLLPPDQLRESYLVLSGEDTRAFVLFPVALGILGVSFFCYIPGSSRMNRTWLAVSASSGAIAAILGWIAWGFAFRITAVIDSNLEPYRDERVYPPRRATVEQGNTIWPSFAGLLMITAATCLIVVKMFVRPPLRAKPEETELGSLQEKDRILPSD